MSTTLRPSPWPGPPGLIPSAFALLATPARLGLWSWPELAEFLGIRPVTPDTFLGWSILLRRGVAQRVGEQLGRRADEIKLGADLRAWYPPALLPLLCSSDPTKDDRLRFCYECLRGGYHSPLFQLPWWKGCPVHGDTLLDSCPSCGTALPSGLQSDSPAHWLQCHECGHILATAAELAGVHRVAILSEHRQRWTEVVAAYRRWQQATSQIEWPLPLSVKGEGEGQFPEMTRHVVAHLASVVQPDALIARHLAHSPPTLARVWQRCFIETPSLPSALSLGFSTNRAMHQAACRFYGAMPITPESFRTLATCYRHLRRRLGVNLIGRGAPKGDPDVDVYDWHGPLPLEVVAFKILTGLTAIDRVDGVAYFDLRAPELLMEPPAYLAQIVLEKWTSIDLLGIRRPPESLQREVLLLDPSRVVAARSAYVKRAPSCKVPASALRWLYERLVVETWHDVASEFFARSQSCGTIGWRVGEYNKRPGQIKLIAVPEVLQSCPLEAMSHPFLVDARASRKRPRQWAVGIMRVKRGERENTDIALMGRASNFEFGIPATASFKARWILPAWDPEHMFRPRTQVST